MLRQVEPGEWNRSYDVEDLCEVPFSVDEFTEMYGFEFLEHNEDGLGPCFFAYADIEGQKLSLRGHSSRSSSKLCVIVRMQGNNPDPQGTLDSLLVELGIKKNELKWVREDLSSPKWALTRQGDDGNEVEICRFHRKGSAEHVMNEFTSRGHKQCYFIYEKE